MKIKKIIITFFAIALLLSMKCYSQVTTHIVDTTKQWNVFHSFSIDNYGVVAYTETFRITSLDTLINDKVYYSLQKSDDYDTIQQLWNTWHQIDWIREDSGRVYVFTNKYNMATGEASGEYLLFDFNLALGDTLTIDREYENYYGGSSEFRIRVVGVDSLEIGGQSLKRLYIHDEYRSADNVVDEVWIEGIGSNHGLTSSFDFTSSGHYSLLCLHQNDELIYNEGPSCYVQMGIDYIHTNNTIQIYPTIAKENVNISSILNGYNIYLFDMYGRKVLSKENNNQSTSINISSLPKGVYEIIITDYNNKILHQDRRIIKL